jgi:microcystin-dependent protein
VPVETFNYLDSLNVNNPPTSDGLVGGDDHIRGIKATLKNTFPNLTGPVNSTQAQIDAIVALLVNGVLRGNGAAFPGMIADHGGTTPPTGWLVCDGQAVSRTTYVDLYNAIGTTWGAGDGSTTFNVPNLLSRFRRHRDNSTLAGAVGVLKSPANLAHSHGVNGVTGLENQGHTHDVQGSTGAMSANNVHSHTYNTPGLTTTGGGAFAAGGPGTPATTSAVDINHTHFFDVTSGAEQQNHNHNVNIQSGGGTADDPNEARPFSAAVLTCIKT